MTPEEKRREKAKMLRYKKPAMKELNLEEIQRNLQEMSEFCDEIAYFFRGNADDSLLDALDGDEEEEYEFQMAFIQLSTDCQQMYSDLYEQWVPECFDLFFPAIGAGGLMDMMGYDAVEEDYYGLEPYEYQFSEEIASERIQRMTKRDLIEAAGQCFKVAFSYLGLKSRYQDLRAAFDILKAQNVTDLQQIRAIYDAYDAAAAEDFDEWKPNTKRFNAMIAALPGRMWIE